MATTLGYVDELIRHIDSNRKIWHTISKQGLAWVKPEKSLAADLAMSPKFTLPTLGQFYRPLNELQENSRRKYPFYIEDYEIDMLRYPPYEMFVLEFKGHDNEVNIASSVVDEKQMDKYVMVCRTVERDGNKGIASKVYYFNEHGSSATSGGKIIFPAGWMTNGIEYAQYYEPPEARERHPRESGYLVSLRALGWRPPDMTDKHLMEYATALWPEFRALYQFLVVMNVKHGVTRRTVSTPKSLKPTLAGRRLGYEYHVLAIDPEYVAESVSSGSGSHASPRFHLRRAHLRHLSSGKVTFVRQAQVGNPLLGTIVKDYTVKKDSLP